MNQTTSRRLLVFSMAAAAALLVVVPTQMREPWTWLSPYWMYRGMVALANTAALGASLLAVVLMIKVPRDEAAYSLALVLAASAASFGLWSADFQIHALDSGWLLRAAKAAQYTLAVLAGAAYMRFGATFPRRIAVGDVTAALAPQRPGADPVFRDSWGLLGGRIDRSIHERVEALPPRNPVSRLSRRYRAFSKRQATKEGSNLERVVATHRWLLQPANPWRAATSLAILIIGLCAAGWFIVAAVLGASAAFMAWAFAHIHMRIGYASCTEAERQRALWVVEGFLLILVPGAVVEAVLMPLVLMNVPVTEMFAGSYLIALAAGAVGLVVCLAIATFYSGSFDSGLVIRRTTVYSAIVVILTGIFAVVENIVTTAIAAYTPLPPNAGVMVGAVAIALAFLPLRAKLKTFVERRMPALASADTREKTGAASLEEQT